VLLNLGARPNRQPLDNTQWKTTRAPAARKKPFRSVTETGQTASVRLSLSIGRGNRSDHRPGRFCPELPKNPSKRKPASRTSPPLNKNSHNTTKTFLPRNSSRQPTWLNRSDQFCLDSREEHNPQEKLKTPSDRSPNSFHGSK
jgi:hypothetical protein